MMHSLPLVVTEAAIREAGFASVCDPVVDWAMEIRPLPLDSVEGGTSHSKGG